MYQPDSSRSSSRARQRPKSASSAGRTPKLQLGSASVRDYMQRHNKATSRPFTARSGASGAKKLASARARPASARPQRASGSGSGSGSANNSRSRSRSSSRRPASASAHGRARRASAAGSFHHQDSTFKTTEYRRQQAVGYAGYAGSCGGGGRSTVFSRLQDPEKPSLARSMSAAELQHQRRRKLVDHIRHQVATASLQTAQVEAAKEIQRLKRRARLSASQSAGTLQRQASGSATPAAAVVAAAATTTGRRDAAADTVLALQQSALETDKELESASEDEASPKQLASMVSSIKRRVVPKAVLTSVGGLTAKEAAAAEAAAKALAAAQAAAAGHGHGQGQGQVQGQGQEQEQQEQAQEQGQREAVPGASNPGAAGNSDLASPGRGAGPSPYASRAASPSSPGRAEDSDDLDGVPQLWGGARAKPVERPPTGGAWNRTILGESVTQYRHYFQNHHVSRDPPAHQVDAGIFNPLPQTNAFSTEAQEKYQQWAAGVPPPPRPQPAVAEPLPFVAKSTHHTDFQQPPSGAWAVKPQQEIRDLFNTAEADWTTESRSKFLPWRSKPAQNINLGKGPDGHPAGKRNWMPQARSDWRTMSQTAFQQYHERPPPRHVPRDTWLDGPGSHNKPDVRAFDTEYGASNTLISKALLATQKRLAAMKRCRAQQAVPVVAAAQQAAGPETTAA